MTKSKKTVRATASDELSGGRELNWKEERFVEVYIRTGNAAHAAREAGYGSGNRARFAGRDLLTKAHIQEAVELEKERWREMAKIDREEVLRILVGMATATLDDFTDVLKNPEDKAAFKNLGHKRYALKSAKKSLKNGNEIQLVDRKAALDDLWDKLGLGQESSKQDWSDGLGRVLGLLEQFKRPSGASS